jgi:DNA-binding MarR family transcriptional regulator
MKFNRTNENNTNEAMLASLDRVMRLLRRRPSRRTNLGRGVYRLLTMIRNQKDISTRELASLLEIRPSSLNEKLLLLENEQLISRMRSSNDQRVFLVQLLPAGEAHLERIHAERKEFYETVGQILTEDEAEHLIELTNKLAEGIEAISDPKAENQESDQSHENHVNGSLV